MTGVQSLPGTRRLETEIWEIGGWGGGEGEGGVPGFTFGLGLKWNNGTKSKLQMGGGGGEGERQRQRETERDRERQRETSTRLYPVGNERGGDRRGRVVSNLFYPQSTNQDTYSPTRVPHPFLFPWGIHSLLQAE